MKIQEKFNYISQYQFKLSDKMKNILKFGSVIFSSKKDRT